MNADGCRLHVEAIFRNVGIADSRKIWCNHRELVHQLRYQWAPHARSLCIAVQENHRRTVPGGEIVKFYSFNLTRLRLNDPGAGLRNCSILLGDENCEENCQFRTGLHCIAPDDSELRLAADAVAECVFTIRARLFWGPRKLECVCLCNLNVLKRSNLRTCSCFLRLTLLIAILTSAKGMDAQASPTAPPVQAQTTSPHVSAPLPHFPRLPGDGAGAYKTGRYRDLFAEQGHATAETRAKIDKAFQQLFHGDGQEERLYFETGANENGALAYITDWANNDARTEGMSYGMMIAVQLNKKREFDAIWNWAKTYMLVTDPKNPSIGYFAWSMNTDGTPRSTGAAPDGEEYFVMALYFAAHRRGNGNGIYDYQAEANKILSGMRHHPVLSGTGLFRIHPEDPPFVPPNHPWPSPNNKPREKTTANGGSAPPPFVPRQGARTETIGPMVDEEHFMIRF